MTSMTCLPTRSIIAREMFTDMQHPIAGTIQQIGFPIKFSETPGKMYTHAPLLGEHTEQILTQLGYAKADIERLREAGVTGQVESKEKGHV